MIQYDKKNYDEVIFIINFKLLSPIPVEKNNKILQLLYLHIRQEYD